MGPSVLSNLELSNSVPLTERRKACLAQPRKNFHFLGCHKTTCPSDVSENGETAIAEIYLHICVPSSINMRIVQPIK